MCWAGISRKGTDAVEADLVWEGHWKGWNPR